jgi:DNA-binding transcriptional regulator YiaG
LSKRLADPARAAKVAAMRQRIGAAVIQNVNSPQGGLVGLRLKVGLSQQELAARMQTKQPSVARWEREPGQIKLENLHRLAKALDVDWLELAAVLKPCGLT